MKTLSEKLICEKKAKYHGGIYHKLQIDFAYNSNHMEGSKLTHDQTRYIYETKTIDAQNIPVNDIIEMVNHFKCFDHVLETLSEPITEEYIEHLHKMLKSGVLADEEFIVIGDYKTEANIVGEVETASPNEVSEQMKNCLVDITANRCHFTTSSVFMQNMKRYTHLMTATAGQED